MEIQQVINSVNPNGASVSDASQGLYRVELKTGQGKGTSAGDSVKLSQEGTILNELSLGKPEWGQEFKTVPPIPHTASELNDWLNEYTDAVRKSIEKLFSQNQVQLQHPVTLQNSAEQGVQVAGQHPQSQRIQSVLDNNPQVADQLQTLNQRADLFQALAHGNDLRLASNESEQKQAADALSAYLQDSSPYRLTVSPGSDHAASNSRLS